VTIGSKRQHYNFKAEYHVSNAAELIVVTSFLNAEWRRSVSSRQSAAVVDQLPHHVIVIDDRRQLERSHIVLYTPC